MIHRSVEYLAAGSRWVIFTVYFLIYSFGPMKEFTVQQTIPTAMLQGSEMPSELQAHPIASKTDWSPLVPGGTVHKTHDIRVLSTTRALFATSAQSRTFSVFVTAVGISGLGLGLFRLFEMATPFNSGLTLLVGTMFTAAGLWMYKSGEKSIIFDKAVGAFWAGKQPTPAKLETSSASWCKLEDIAGIQVISEQIGWEKFDMESYELNLVLKDSRRLNVVDHGNMNQVKADAIRLSKFLQVPVWDAV